MVGVSAGLSGAGGADTKVSETSTIKWRYAGMIGSYHPRIVLKSRPVSPSSVEKEGTVLIVDDVPSGIRVIADILSDLYTIIVATNGEDAIAAATEQVPDLILLDVDMPGMNGLAVCRHLKLDLRTRDIPVVFVTMLDSEDDEVAGLRENAVDYVTKPIRPEALRLRIERHMAVSRQRRRVPAEYAVTLSIREQECLKLLADGRLNDRIAEMLNISPGTVEFHIRNARRKLGAATREQALAKAITLGLI